MAESSSAATAPSGGPGAKGSPGTWWKSFSSRKKSKEIPPLDSSELLFAPPNSSDSWENQSPIGNRRNLKISHSGRFKEKRKPRASLLAESPQKLFEGGDGGGAAPGSPAPAHPSEKTRGEWPVLSYLALLDCHLPGLAGEVAGLEEQGDGLSLPGAAACFVHRPPSSRNWFCSVDKTLWRGWVIDSQISLENIPSCWWNGAFSILTEDVPFILGATKRCKCKTGAANDAMKRKGTIPVIFGYVPMKLMRPGIIFPMKLSLWIIFWVAFMYETIGEIFHFLNTLYLLI